MPELPSSKDNWQRIQERIERKRNMSARRQIGQEAMPSKLIQTPYDKLTRQIIGCAMGTHRHFGAGYRENTYQRDLQVRFTESGLAYIPEKKLEVYDSSQGNVLIGYYIPDFIVAETVVVEIKALRGLDNSHIAQIIGYLAVTGYPVGLLINFGTRSLQWKRIFPPRDVAAHRVNRQWLWVPPNLPTD